MDEKILELCEKIIDMSAEYNVDYKTIMTKIQEQLDYESFMAEY